ncbi:hypothetical protein N7492_007423 [Penicillium capsulatum]|uniref:Uncharacterized protein n=1 Tax=Penicillium capsulatum TaxID=69766 RepID=A0A9W9LM19_9EURO|nr:hypothetical protein N7492_007423 [Penicillium capsulatum]KAJ6117259.1 hypothetical protein N7512_006984 [Penicillium capsulatum]
MLKWKQLFLLLPLQLITSLRAAADPICSGSGLQLTSCLTVAGDLQSIEEVDSTHRASSIQVTEASRKGTSTTAQSTQPARTPEESLANIPPITAPDMLLVPRGESPDLGGPGDPCKEGDSLAAAIETPIYDDYVIATVDGAEDSMKRLQSLRIQASSAAMAHSTLASQASGSPPPQTTQT